MMEDKVAQRGHTPPAVENFTPPTASQLLRLQRADARVAEAAAALLEVKPELRAEWHRFAA